MYRVRWAKCSESTSVSDTEKEREGKRGRETERKIVSVGGSEGGKRNERERGSEGENERGSEGERERERDAKG